MTAPLIQLKILLPAEVLLCTEARQVNGESANGHFCLLPRHADFVTTLVPGLLAYLDDIGRERFLAVDEGALVKHGYDVMVSTRSAVAGDDLGTLNDVVTRQFERLDDREKLARSASAQLEASLVRRFMDLEIA